MFELQYPTRNGIAINPREIELPETKLDFNEKNLHHLEWLKRLMGKFAILTILRDLDSLQSGEYIDVHNWLHTQFEPPELPTIRQAMDYIDDAYNHDEKLQTGSLKHPKYLELGDIAMQACINEYNSYKTHTNSNIW
jgi:hypothetical protein